MGLQLTPLQSNATIEGFTTNVVTTFSLLGGVGNEKVISFTMDRDQFGGTFTATLEAQENSYGFLEEQIIAAATIGSVSYPGVIKKIRESVGKSGMVLTVSGNIIPAGLRYTTNLSFSSADPFLTPSGDIIPGPAIPLVDNHYRLLGLNAGIVVNTLSARSGIPVFVGLPSSYPIWNLQLPNQTVMKSFDTVAQPAGANAILRFDSGVGAVSFLPWGSYFNAVSIDFCELLTDFKPTFERSDFTDVVLQPSSDMTPWNSTYAGVPEPFGDLTFEASAGSPAIDGNSAQVTTQPSSDWIFPEDGVNRWFKYETPAGNLNKNIRQDFGISGAWKAEQIDSYTTKTSYGTASPAFKKSVPQGSKASIIDSAVSGVYSGTSSTPEVIAWGTPLSTPEVRNIYNLLISWTTAAKRFQINGDILPFFALLPASEASPQFVENFDVDSTDLYTVLPVGFGRMAESLDSRNPSEVGGITPLTFVCEAFDDPTLSGNPDFAEDGSFYIGVNPHNHRIRTYSGVEPVVDQTNSATYKTYSDMIITAPSLEDATLVDTSTAPPGTTVNGSSLSRPSIKNKVVIVKNTSGSDDTEKRDNLADLKSDIADKAYRLIDLKSVISPTAGGIRVISIDQTSGNIVDTVTGPELRIVVDILPAVAVTTTLKLSKSVTNNVTITSGYTNPELAFSSSSGNIDESAAPLKGSWKMFAFRRKVFTPIVYAPVNVSVTPVFSFTGQIKTTHANPKVVSSSLITDFWSPNVQITHAANFVRTLSNYLSQPFTSFSAEVVYQNGSLYEPGDLVTVTNYPGVTGGRAGNVSSIATRVKFSVSFSAGARVTYTCGRFPTI